MNGELKKGKPAKKSIGLLNHRHTIWEDQRWENSDLLHHSHHGDGDGKDRDDASSSSSSSASSSSSSSCIASSSSSSSSSAISGAMERDTRCKVVVRHLPPFLTEAAFIEEIESRFAGLYHWISFCPATSKSSRGTHINSRAYIHFKQPEDVLLFYENFNGHKFVNEKGVQFKALVEYSPYQRVPKLSFKKDMREGTILKDPEYLEFVEKLAKPVEYLPSAEVQLERREAEKAACLASSEKKDSIIVTPLMEFVRQKRASKAGLKRMSTSGKLGARGGGLSRAAILSKQGVGRSRVGSTGATDGGSLFTGGVGNGNLTPRSNTLTSSKSISGSINAKQQGATSPGRGVSVVSGYNRSRHRDTGVRYNHVSSSPMSSHATPEASSQSGMYVEKDQRLLRPQNSRTLQFEADPSAESVMIVSNELDKSQNQYMGKSLLHGGQVVVQRDFNEGLVTDARKESSEASMSITSMFSQGNHNQQNASQKDASGGIVLLSRSSEVKIQGKSAITGNENRESSPQISYSVEKGRRALEPHGSWNGIGGNQRQTRRGRIMHGRKDNESSLAFSESSKHSKRGGGSSAYGGHEKQVWVAKSGSGS